MERNRQRTPDFYSGIFFFLLGGIMCFSSWWLGLGRPSKPGPGFMPFIIGASIVFLSSVILYQSLPRNDNAFWEIKLRLRKIIPVLGAMVVYGIFLERIGFILCTFLFIAFLMKYSGAHSWMKSLLGGAIASAFLYVLFVNFLKVSLPPGLLGSI